MSLLDVRINSAGYHAGEPLLHDVALTVKPGELIGLIGSNGAGAIRLMAQPVMAVWALEAAWLIGLAWHGAGLLLLAVGLALWWFAAAWFAVPELDFSSEVAVVDDDGRK